MKLFDSVREIPITDLEGLRIGNAQDYEAMTGVTVLLFDHGANSTHIPHHRRQSAQCYCTLRRLCLRPGCQ